MSKRKELRDGYFQFSKQSDAERRSNRDVKQIAASVMGLAYGPSECRREDADEYLAVKVNAGGLIAQSTLFDSHQVIPVCYGYTRNRAILETKYSLETAARL